jgi:hypothetical protein
MLFVHSELVNDLPSIHDDCQLLGYAITKIVRHPLPTAMVGIHSQVK